MQKGQMGKEKKTELRGINMVIVKMNVFLLLF